MRTLSLCDYLLSIDALGTFQFLWQNSLRKKIKSKRFYFSSQFEGRAHLGREVKASGG